MRKLGAAIFIGLFVILVAVILANAFGVSVDALDALGRAFAFLEGETSLGPAQAGDLLLILVLVLAVLVTNFLITLINLAVGVIRWLFDVLAGRTDADLPVMRSSPVPAKLLLFAVFGWVLSFSAAGLTSLLP